MSSSLHSWQSDDLARMQFHSARTCSRIENTLPHIFDDAMMTCKRRTIWIRLSNELRYNMSLGAGGLHRSLHAAEHCQYCWMPSTERSLCLWRARKLDVLKANWRRLAKWRTKSFFGDKYVCDSSCSILSLFEFGCVPGVQCAAGRHWAVFGRWHQRGVVMFK